MKLMQWKTKIFPVACCSFLSWVIAMGTSLFSHFSVLYIHLLQSFALCQGSASEMHIKWSSPNTKHYGNLCYSRVLNHSPLPGKTCAFDLTEVTEKKHRGCMFMQVIAVLLYSSPLCLLYLVPFALRVKPIWSRRASTLLLISFQLCTAGIKARSAIWPHLDRQLYLLFSFSQSNKREAVIASD